MLVTSNGREDSLGIQTVLNMGGARAAYDDHDQINSLVTEATASANSAAKAQWLVGAFFAQSWLTNHSELTQLGQDQALIFGQTRHDVLAEAAVYGEATVPLGSSLSLTLGGRAFSTEVRTSSHSLGGGATRADPFAGNLHHTDFVPKLVLAYSGWAPALVYVQAAEGYRPAGFNTSPNPSQILSAAGGPEPLRNYQKDELWSLETGAKFSMFDERLAIRLALFEAFWRNIQSDQLLPSGLSYTANIGNGQNLGLEFEGRYRHGPLILYGGFLYNGPELVRSNRAFGARSDFGLAVVPDLSVGVAAEYSWPLSADCDLLLDGRVNYVGGSRLALAPSPAVKMGDYATGRLAMTLLTPRWSIGLAVNNPSGTKGNTFAYGNPFSLGQSGQVTPLRPRTVTMSLESQF